MSNTVAKQNNLTDNLTNNNAPDENDTSDENDTNNQTDNQQDKPATLGNAIASSEENDEAQTKNVALTGKDAENMLKKQQAPINNSNPAKKNTKKNNTINTQNVKRNNANQTLTQKQPENATASGNANTNTPDETANTNLEGTINTNTPTSKDIMVSLNKLTMNLLNHQIVLKLFHFQTELYGAHKASDSYLEKYAQTMDKFLEIAQGIYGKISLKKYTLTGSSHSDNNIIKHLDGMITLLREKIDDVLDDYTDLINVRDELVGDAEQLKYLLSFK